MIRNNKVQMSESEHIIKKISFGITLIIMGTILCSGTLMHIIVN